jgi:hypothetical protein
VRKFTVIGVKISLLRETNDLIFQRIDFLLALNRNTCKKVLLEIRYTCLFFPFSGYQTVNTTLNQSVELYIKDPNSQSIVYQKSLKETWHAKR